MYIYIYVYIYMYIQSHTHFVLYHQDRCLVPNDTKHSSNDPDLRMFFSGFEGWHMESYDNGCVLKKCPFQSLVSSWTKIVPIDLIPSFSKI